jgi:hypothetical protein
MSIEIILRYIVAGQYAYARKLMEGLNPVDYAKLMVEIGKYNGLREDFINEKR